LARPGAGATKMTVDRPAPGAESHYMLGLNFLVATDRSRRGAGRQAASVPLRFSGERRPGPGARPGASNLLRRPHLKLNRQCALPWPRLQARRLRRSRARRSPEVLRLDPGNRYAWRPRKRTASWTNAYAAPETRGARRRRRAAPIRRSGVPRKQIGLRRKRDHS
jgi:hypothetical protein